MFNRRLVDSPFRLGLLVGLVFGVVNLIATWLYPLADDGAGALLRFYGPMFFVWTLASFRAARQSGRLLTAVTTGLIIAFATFLVFDLLVILRVNLFLDELAGRADWQNLMQRYRASDFDSRRVFVNRVYLLGSPLKIGVASAIGAAMGFLGGSLGLTFRRVTAASSA
jgi:hypothetical protein